MKAPTFAIVGGGASGTLLALQLLRQARRPLEVVLIEPRRHLGRGLAYDAAHIEHLLNVPAGRMSALPDEPDHFARWLERAVGHSVAGRFVPRQIYGLYLQETLDAARASASSGVRLNHVEGTVQSVDPGPNGVASVYVSGVSQAIRAQRVALALGNLPGPGPLPELAGHPLYVEDPWAPNALECVGGGDLVLLVGSGLTMVDVALTLTMSERRTPLVAVSRHGLLPQSHAAPSVPAPEAVPLLSLPSQVRTWMRALRQAPAGTDWRARIDALRPLTPRLWARLGPAEQRRFLRHVRPYWETRRHRLAPEVAQAIQGLVRHGGLRVQAGRIVGVEPAGARLDLALVPRGSAHPQRLRVDRVVNATGPETDVTRVRSPLLQQLLRDGLARPDALRLGLDAAPGGQLVDSHGRPSPGLYALGPLLRGALWETTAVPEIRLQAADLARAWLAASLDARSAAQRPRATEETRVALTDDRLSIVAQPE